MSCREGKNRVRNAVALVAVLALGLAAPARAAGWGGWGEGRELVREFLSRVLDSLGPTPNAGASLKCDDGLHIDPNGGGCHKAAGGSGLPDLPPAGTKKPVSTSSKGRF